MAIAYPSTPVSGPASLGDVFPTLIVHPERLVYDQVLAACTPDPVTGLAQVGFYSDRAGPAITVVRGWPAYPGPIPAIGIAEGPETEDKAQDLSSGGFAGDAVHYDPATGELVGSATYYSEPIYSTVIVELIHENRDERDRLHNELRRVLFPLRRQLPEAEHLIRKATVDAEKADQDVGTPKDEQPLIVYISIFTIHVYHEMLEAHDVRGPESVIERIDVTVQAELAEPAA